MEGAVGRDIRGCQHLASFSGAHRLMAFETLGFHKVHQRFLTLVLGLVSDAGHFQVLFIQFIAQLLLEVLLLVPLLQLLKQLLLLMMVVLVVVVMLLLGYRFFSLGVLMLPQRWRWLRRRLRRWLTWL